MKTTYIEGENRCYVCNYLIEWHHSFPTSISRMEVHKLTGVDTDIIAVDKDTAGTIKFEVICKCPGCKTKNKFYAVAE